MVGYFPRSGSDGLGGFSGIARIVVVWEDRRDLRAKLGRALELSLLSGDEGWGGGLLGRLMKGV